MSVQVVPKRAKPGVVTAGLLAFSLISGVAAVAEARPAPNGFADLAEKVTPAVVNVAVEIAAPEQVTAGRGSQPHPFNEFFERFFGQPYSPQGPGLRPEQHRKAPVQRGQGSGFFIDDAGHVVTNHHVVDGASKIELTLTDGRKLMADVVGSDPRTDLALLKTSSDAPLPFVEFGRSKDVRVGDWIMAVGNPFGLGGSVTAGIISADGRNINRDGLVDFLQIDAPINRGNSGGPLFDMNGKVIGVNTAIFSPNGGNVGIGFSIPSDDVKRIVTQLKEGGTVNRGWIGAQVQPLSPELAEGLNLPNEKGALIAGVAAGAPAEKGGLEAGDVVVAWNGKPVESLRDLLRLVAANPAGVAANAKIYRDGIEREVTVTPEAAPQKVAALTSVPAKGAQGAALAGAGLQLANTADGVVIADVQPGSPAESKGLQKGDVIVTLSGRETPTLDILNAVVSEVRAEKQGADKAILVLQVRREQSDRFVPLAIDIA